MYQVSVQGNSKNWAVYTLLKKIRERTNAVPNIMKCSKRGWKITVHHQGPCCPCVKYGRETDIRWFHGRVISPAAFEAIKKVSLVTDASCICRVCDAWWRRQARALAEDKHNSPKSAEKKQRQQFSVIGFTELMHCCTELDSVKHLSGHDIKKHGPSSG